MTAATHSMSQQELQWFAARVAVKPYQPLAERFAKNPKADSGLLAEPRPD